MDCFNFNCPFRVNETSSCNHCQCLACPNRDSHEYIITTYWGVMTMYDELVKRLREPCQYENCVLCQQAADAIEELSKPRWIPVTERLPEPYTWVLVSAEKHKVAFDAFYDGAQWKDAVLNVLIVTHWMPLPEPPKEE